MVHSNKKTGRIVNRMLMIALLVGIGVFLEVERVWAQEKIPESYTLTIHYPDGRRKIIEKVIFHKLIYEENTTFMSVILKDGRRFLLSVNDREFEFSKELSQIIEAEDRKNAEEQRR